MTLKVQAPALKRMLRDGQELALLDVREEGRFAAGHPLYAVPLPLSRLELRIRPLKAAGPHELIQQEIAAGLQPPVQPAQVSHGKF